MKSKTLIIAVIVILIGFSSCVSSKYAKAYDRTEKAYIGPEQNKASLATIDMGEILASSSIANIKKGNIPADYKEYLLLFQVDSIPVTKGVQALSPKRCEILPGVHTIEVIHRQYDYLTFFLGRYLVTFKAEAGKTYSIKADTNHEKREVDMYVIDSETGERIDSTIEYKYTLNENSNSHSESRYSIYKSSSSFPKITSNAYAGPKQKKSSLAFVRGVSMPTVYVSTDTYELTTLIQVDSVPVTNIRTTFKQHKYKYNILPGTHTIEITHYQEKNNIPFVLGSYLVTFDTKVGRTYIIKAETVPGTNMVDVYVTDADSGKRIESTVDYKYKINKQE